MNRWHFKLKVGFCKNACRDQKPVAYLASPFHFKILVILDKDANIDTIVLEFIVYFTWNIMNETKSW